MAIRAAETGLSGYKARCFGRQIQYDFWSLPPPFFSILCICGRHGLINIDVLKRHITLNHLTFTLRSHGFALKWKRSRYCGLEYQDVRG
jgi:hypothetical protein